MCVPNGTVPLAGSKRLVASSPGSRPAGTPPGLPVEVGGDKGHLGQGFLPAGVSGDVDSTVAIGHILWPDVKHVGGKLFGFVLDFLDRHLQRRPAHGQAAAAKRANAVWDHVRVAVDDLDMVERHPEGIGDQLV